MGPVESFTPLDYDKAAAGGDFVEIGVGVLTRPTPPVILLFAIIYFATRVSGGRQD